MRRVGLLSWWTVLLVCGCGMLGCSTSEEDDDTSFPPVNSAPIVAIDAPVNGASVDAGAPVTFSGTVSDDQDAPGALSVVWTSSIDGPLHDGPPDGQGQTEFTTSSLSVGQHSITLEATDTAGLSASASVDLVVSIPPNQPPTAEITSPKAGAVFPSGAKVTLFGHAEDREDGPDALLVQFQSSLTGPLTDWFAPDANGQVSATVPLEDGAHDLILLVEDSEGAEGISESVPVVVTPNEPPEVAFEPLNQTLFNESESVLLVAVVGDDSTDPTQLGLEWTSSVDGPLACPATGDVYGDVTCRLSDLSPGDHEITLVATDEAGKTGSDAVELTINGIPASPEVAIEPLEPKTSDDLRATIVTPSEDPDGDAISYGFSWRRDNVVVPGLDGDTVPATYTAKGEVWTVDVVPSDGYATGPAATATVTIANTPPELTTVSIAPTSGYASTTFYCLPSGFYDADGDPEGYAYRWLADDEPVEGAEAATYVPVGMKHGQALACEATPTDGVDAGVPVRSSAATIQGRPPSIASVAIDPETGGEGTTFTCIPSGWSDPDDDAPDYLFQWWVNDIKGPSTETISGASFNKHDMIRCEVTPFDGFLTGSTVGSAAIAIENTSPEVAGVHIDPDPAYANSLLRCQTDGYQDIDGDAEEATFAWTINGSEVEAARTVTLDRGVQRGDEVGCTAYVSDGEATPVQLEAEPRMISNSPPTIASVGVNPPSGSVQTTFTAVPLGYNDIDGDEPAYRYQWYVNDVATVTTESIQPGNFGMGDTIFVEVTPYDPYDAGTTRASATITIGSTTNPPSIQEASLGPEEAYEGTELTCTPVGASDPEDDPITFTYGWTRNGESVPGADTQRLTGKSFDKHDLITCTITPHDPELTGAAVTSDVVAIRNTPPAADGAAITPAEPTKASTLTCTLAGLSDDDGDAISVAFAWTVNGVLVEGASAASLSNANFSAGDTVVCTGTPDDGESSGTPVSSAPVEILQSPPEIGQVTLEPAVAYETTELVCSADGVLDIDGDQVSLSYAWYLGSTRVNGQTGTTLTGEVFDKGDAVTCRVTPSAAGQTGAAVSSNTVVIQNTVPTIDEVRLGPSPAYETSVLTCEAVNVRDVDGETPVLSYTWKVGGSTVSASGAELDGTYFNRGDTVQCTVVASDSEASGMPVSSNTLTISNTPPTLLEVFLTPEEAYTDTVLTCSPGEASDVDGDVVSFTYEWLKNGQVIQGAGTPYLSGSLFERGDRILCAVTPNDEVSEGERVTSNEVTILNALPTIRSVSLKPQEATETSVLTCTPNDIADRDGDSVTVTYAWTVDGITVSGATTSTLTGESFDRDQAVACTVTPHDGIDAGEPVTSNTVVIVNSRPSVAEVQLTPTTAYEETVLTCSAIDVLDDDPGDVVSLSYLWLVSGNEIDAVTGPALDGTWFDKGDVVTCLITPDDGTDQGVAVKSNDVPVVNSAPTVSGVSLGPDPATEASVLTCSYESLYDADGDSVDVSYAWMVDGAVLDGETAPTLSPDYFSRDEQVWCRITPYDGSESGDGVDSNVVTIANTPPSIDTVEIFPAQAYESTTLECRVTGINDIDGDSVTVSYAWYVDDSLVDAATESTLTGTYFDKNQSVTCVATPDDGTSPGTPVTSNVREILNTPPSVTGATVTPATATEASTLTCSAESPSDDDPADSITLTFEWLVGTEIVLSESAPAGSTGTLDGTWFDRDDQVRCRITPDDGTDSGTPVTSSTVTIENTAPVVSGVTIEPDMATKADTLTCTHSPPSDIDGDAVTVVYAWTVNGALVVGETGATLDPGYFSKGNEVQCTATPTDGTDAGTPVTSGVLVILNSPPTIGAVALTPAEAYETSVLSCDVSGVADVDGDDVTLTIAWTVGGSPVTGVDTPTLSGDYFDRGDTVTCSVTPNDGTADGSTVVSDPVVILNSPPVVASLSLGPAQPTESSTLVCEAVGVADDDPADSVTLVFQWDVTGQSPIVDTVTGGTTSTLTGTDFDRGDEVTCTVTPTDGTDSGSPVVAGPLTILNTAPTVDGVTLAPDPAYVTTTFTCSHTTTADVDGDTVTVSYAWFVDGLAVTGATSSTLSPGPFVKGSQVGCAVTPNDGTVDGDPVFSNLVTVSNSVPTVDAVSLSPDPAYEASVITCSATNAADADGETVSLQYTWAVDGVTVGGQTGATLTGTYFDKGEAVACTVVPSDGTETGDPVTSDPLTIQNTPPELLSISLGPALAFADTLLTCTVDMTDDDPADLAGLTVIYAWTVGGQVVDGATGATLSGAFVKGESVACTATPDDGTDQGSPLTSDIIVISNSAPVADPPAISPTEPREASTLECIPGALSDVDGDEVAVSYAWYVNDVEVSAQTGSTLTGDDFSKGDSVVCETTPSDGTDLGTAVQSDPVVILNTPPSVASVALTPATAYRASTLTCSPQGPSDVDGDPVNFTFAWLVNGSRLQGQTGSELSGQFEKGNSVQCEVTPSDGFDDGTPVLSNTVVIQNTPPMPATVTIAPEVAYQGDALVATASSSDPDDDPVTFTFAWYKDDVLQSAYTTDTIPAGVTQGGETWRVVATPHDGEDFGPPGEDSVTVLTDNDADGVALQEGDCDDTDDTVYPYAAEILDGQDNDCNTVVDDRWVEEYTYGTPSDAWPAISPDSALGVEADGLTHLYFAGKTGDGTSGATLYNVFDPLTSDFGSVQDLDTILNATYNQISLWEQDGLPTEVRVMVYDLDAGKVYLQNFDGTSWSGPMTPSPLSGVASSGTALVTTSDGTDYLLYTTSPGEGGCGTGSWETKLLLASRANGSTSFTFVYNPLSSGCGADGTLVLGSPSIAVGADDVLHVSWYVDTTSRPADIRYRRVIPGGTSSDNIDAVSVGDVGQFSAIAVVPGEDPSYPHIAYYDDTNKEIRLASCTDFGTYTFTTSLIAGTTDLGGSVPAAGAIVLRFGSDGTGHVTFLAEAGVELWYATDASGAWVAEKVLTATASLSGHHYGMVVDGDGNPRILYKDTTNEDIRLWKGKVHTTTLPY